MAPHRECHGNINQEREPDAKRMGERRIDTKNQKAKHVLKKEVYLKKVVMN